MHRTHLRLRTAVGGCVLWLAGACGDASSGEGTGSSSGEAEGSGTASAGSTTTASTTTAGSTTAGSTTAGSTTASTTSATTGPSDDSGGSSDTGDQGRDYGNDRSKFFGDARCDVAGLQLCDSFEDGALDQAVWQQSGTVTIDAAKGARGAGSLHVHTEGNAFSFVRETVTFPATDNRYWGRMFVWIDAVPVAPDWAHWTLVGARGSGDTSEIRVGGQLNRFAGMTLFGIGSDGGPTGDWTNLDDDPAGAPQAVVVQDWVCIEWLHDGSSNTTEFYWDADLHPSLSTTATEHGGNAGADYVMPQFESVWVGWWLYQGGSNPDHFDVWIDEVAIDPVRIGCVL